MTIVWILLLFFDYMMGFLMGSYCEEVNPCTKNTEDCTHLKHIKECIFNDEISDKDKVSMIKQQLKSLEMKRSDI